MCVCVCARALARARACMCVTCTEIDDTMLGHEALRVPLYVGEGTVHGEMPQRHKKQHGREPHTVGKGPTDKRWGDDGKHELVHHEERLGNVRRHHMSLLYLHTHQPEAAGAAIDSVSNTLATH
jgi:hypothetical protein